ncbi:MAG: hypothetical protein ACI81P_002129, partial [Neolewinella sp.]
VGNGGSANFSHYSEYSKASIMSKYTPSRPVSYRW